MVKTQPRELKYGTHPRQVVQVWPTHEDQAPLLIFVHGGAWRTEDLSWHTKVAETLSQEGVSVALIEYRLSLPTDQSDKTSPIEPQHPSHILDFLGGLSVLFDDNVIQAALSVSIAGHSVGAWLLCSLLLDPTKSLPSSASSSLPPLTQRQAWRSKIKNWFLLDGVYDLTDMLVEYPDYEGFVRQALLENTFPRDEENKVSKGNLTPSEEQVIQRCSTTSWPALQGETGDVWVVQAREDELLSLRQSNGAAKYLRGVLEEGTQVHEAYDAIHGTHDSSIQNQEYFDWLRSIIKTA